MRLKGTMKLTRTILLTLAAALLLVGPASAPAAAKKCKSGYEKKGGKCVRKPLLIKPSKLQLVVGKLRDGRLGATGYAEFPKTSRKAALKGYWHISNGVGYERLKVEWSVAKGATYTNFTDTDRKVGLTGPEMTVTLVIQGVRSNNQPLIK